MNFIAFLRYNFIDKSGRFNLYSKYIDNEDLKSVRITYINSNKLQSFRVTFNYLRNIILRVLFSKNFLHFHFLSEVLLGQYKTHETHRDTGKNMVGKDTICTVLF